ncbi:LAME_0G07756g1_1 [Lachancea meyersii CBS 8951]|uniref:LAME_0G07756g1_1 n=1 Tax=Lachancea meyersii CBS 8951 TaxID=1266667 RepID=A0A1G4K852_9SACH|nr:LAME_0G07756g1_1 [Lachancea meyersii CBS 8951]
MTKEDPRLLECLELVRDRLFSVKKWDETVLSSTSKSGEFPMDIIEALSSREAVGLSGEIVVKKLFTEAGQEVDETVKIMRFAILMDLCHHMKCTAGSTSNEENVRIWTLAFFDLFKMSLSLLQLPGGHLRFWTYIESRTHWFRAGFSSEESLQHGQTSLSAIKAPFAKVTFQINKMLLALRVNSKLATPAHHELSMKINLFLCQCLSPMEQANTNKRGNIAKGAPDQLWDAKKGDKRGSAFYSDFQKVKQEFIENSVLWAFSDAHQRLSLQDYLLPVMDEILIHESDFYNHIKTRKVRLDRLNQKAHQHPLNTFEASERESKKHFSEWPTNPLALRSLMLDQPDWDPELTVSQLQDPFNDFFRKKFVTELAIASNLVHKILTDEATRNFYRIHCDRSSGMRTNEEDDRSTAAALRDISQLITTRVKQFYINRDTKFQRLLSDLIEGDNSLIDLKVKKGFKIFSDFKFPSGDEESYSIPDFSFKSFGWIKLGNKKLDNAWKIKTGLESIESSVCSSQEIYDQLQNRYREETFEESDLSNGDKTVEQWKQIRRLRPKFLFQLSNVDEKTGINGLFDSRLIQKSRENKNQLASKVQVAQEYFEAQKKRKLESVENSDEPPTKKQDLGKTTNISTEQKSDIEATFSTHITPESKKGEDTEIKTEEPHSHTEDETKAENKQTSPSAELSSVEENEHPKDNTASQAKSELQNTDSIVHAEREDSLKLSKEEEKILDLELGDKKTLQTGP